MRERAHYYLNNNKEIIKDEENNDLKLRKPIVSQPSKDKSP